MPRGGSLLVLPMGAGSCSSSVSFSVTRDKCHLGPKRTSQMCHPQRVRVSLLSALSLRPDFLLRISLYSSCNPCRSLFLRPPTVVTRSPIQETQPAHGGEILLSLERFTMKHTTADWKNSGFTKTALTITRHVCSEAHRDRGRGADGCQQETQTSGLTLRRGASSNCPQGGVTKVFPTVPRGRHTVSPCGLSSARTHPDPPTLYSSQLLADLTGIRTDTEAVIP